MLFRWSLARGSIFFCAISSRALSSPNLTNSQNCHPERTRRGCAEDLKESRPRNSHCTPLSARAVDARNALYSPANYSPAN
jgi:hypothetical protein